jgi:geranylgeranyl reductase family protein
VFDVIVIGAGPAGAATAARLHQHGVRRLLLLDGENFPRDKPCGGGLTGRVEEALAALDLRLEVPCAVSPAARIRFGGFERKVALRRPVRVVRRLDFDASLVAQLRARGVELRCGRRVEAIDVDRDAVALRLEGGAALATRIVVGADGVASVVRKHLRGGRAGPHRLFMQEVEASLADAAMTYDFTPMTHGLRGYLWIFPLAGGANVGLMHYPSTPQSGPQLRRLLREGLARHGIELPARGARGWPVWGFDPDAVVAAPRLLTAGDAAGIDALTGEGISVALEHGAIAGDAAARALASGDFGFAGYGRELRRAEIGRELRLDRWLAARVYQAGRRWQHWLSMMLFDRDFVDLYAARVAGTEVLADQKLRLARLIGRHWLHLRRHQRALREALAAGGGLVAAPREVAPR